MANDFTPEEKRAAEKRVHELYMAHPGWAPSVYAELAERLQMQNTRLRKALEAIIPMLEKMDTLRHIDPEFPMLDAARDALQSGGK